MLDPLLEIMNFFIGISDKGKILIGTLALVGIVFGSILAITGAFVLGMGSIIAAFAEGGALAGVWTSLSGAIAAGGAIILGIIAVLAVMVIGFVDAWKDNFAGLQDWVTVWWEGLKKHFGGIIKIFKGDIIGGMSDIFDAMDDLVFSSLAILGISFANGLAVIVESMVDFGKKIVENIALGIIENGTALIDAIASIMPDPIANFVMDKTAGAREGTQEFFNPTRGSSLSEAPGFTGPTDFNITVNAPRQYEITTRATGGG